MSTTSTAEMDLEQTSTSEVAQSGSGPAGLPRLLEGVPAQGAMSLQGHLDIHGEPPPARRRDRRGAAALIDQIEQAGLGGRGGAGFPLARKMRGVAGGKGKPIVVVNATEGEPASLKDRTLLETLPHLVLDGAALAARAIGADEAILCVCESATTAQERAVAAIAERGKMQGQWARVALATAPEGYVSGQESALVSHLNGGEAKPTFTPPAPYERGVRRRPTLVSNAETLAHVALIARHGARWFRGLGLSEQPGSTLITLSGPLAYPGVYEVEFGASLASLIEAAGGMKARVRGALFGGYAGTWIEASALSGLALSNPHLAPYGATLGAGVVALLSEEACPVAERHAGDALAGAPERRPVRALRTRPGRSRRHLRAGDAGGPPRSRGGRPDRAPLGTRRAARRLRSPRRDCALCDERALKCSRPSSPTTPSTAPATPAPAHRSCRCQRERV